MPETYQIYLLPVPEDEQLDPEDGMDWVQRLCAPYLRLVLEALGREEDTRQACAWLVYDVSEMGKATTSTLRGRNAHVRQAGDPLDHVPDLFRLVVGMYRAPARARPPDIEPALHQLRHLAEAYLPDMCDRHPELARVPEGTFANLHEATAKELTALSRTLRDLPLSPARKRGLPRIPRAEPGDPTESAR